VTAAVDTRQAINGPTLIRLAADELRRGRHMHDALTTAVQLAGGTQHSRHLLFVNLTADLATELHLGALNSYDRDVLASTVGHDHPGSFDLRLGVWESQTHDAVAAADALVRVADRMAHALVDAPLRHFGVGGV
jgi:hypothetical protein